MSRDKPSEIISDELLRGLALMSSSGDWALAHKEAEDNHSIGILPPFVFATESENKPISARSQASVAPAALGLEGERLVSLLRHRRAMTTQQEHSGTSAPPPSPSPSPQPCSWLSS